MIKLYLKPEKERNTYTDISDLHISQNYKRFEKNIRHERTIYDTSFDYNNALTKYVIAHNLPYPPRYLQPLLQILCITIIPYIMFIIKHFQFLIILPSFFLLYNFHTVLI